MRTITSAEVNGRNKDGRSSSPPTATAMDLKHIPSTSVLTSPAKSHRQLQHPRATEQRLGSPTSIPSSPTSVRSSSSAIFERDIEPIVSPSPPPSAHHHQPNPHRIPRAKTTEQLNQSVPSVLDSAATILIGMGTDDVANEVSVVSPAASIHEVFERSSGFASPIGSLRSRSSSPVGSKVGAASPRGDILLSIPVTPQATSIGSSPASILGLQNIGSPPAQLPSPLLQPSARPRPSVQTTIAPAIPHLPDMDTPNPLANYPATLSRSSSRQSSPRTTTLEQFPTNVPGSQIPSQYNPSNTLSPSSLNSHPPSPAHFPKKRLSFMSYNDLLSSTPTTTQTLSSLTTCASADPPPHIPSVSGLNVASAVYSSGGCATSASRAHSLRNFSLGAIAIGPMGGLTHPGKRDSIALLDNVGGEWEREGLGKGLEERLDALILSGPPPTTIPIGGKA